MRVLLRAVSFTICHPVNTLTRLCVALVALLVFCAVGAGVLDSVHHTLTALLHWPHMTAADSTTLDQGAPLLVGALIVLVAAVTVPLAWLARWYRIHVSRPTPPCRGARWATPRELRRGGFLAPVGWPIGTIHVRGRSCVVRLPAAREREGVFAFAPPGSGKSYSLAIPAILSEAQRPLHDLRSSVLVDPKDDELWRITQAILSQRLRVLVWDPSNPAACSVTFDPFATLPAPSDASFAEEVSAVVEAWFWATRRGEHTTDPYFINQPLAILKAGAFTYLARHPAGSWVDFADWMRRLTFEEFHKALASSASPYAGHYVNQAKSIADNERAASGIWSDILQRFEILDSPRVRAAMQPGCAIDWPAFIAIPTCLYLRVAVRDAERLGPLLSLFLARMYRALITLAAAQPDKTLPRQVRVFIDEFGNLTRIYGIETALATLRSYGVGHYVFVQTSAQLRRHYGRDIAQSIVDCLVTQVCLGGAAAEDAAAFSKRCGERTDHFPATTYNAGGIVRGGTTSHTHERETRPLVAAWEIVQMTGRVLVSTRGLPPVRATIIPYDDKAAKRRRQKPQEAVNPSAGQHTATAQAPAPLPLSVPVFTSPLHVLSSDDDRTPQDDEAVTQ